MNRTRIAIMAVLLMLPLGCDTQIVTPNDICPNNPQKRKSDPCGCDEANEVLNIVTGTYTCVSEDLCPNDPDKTSPGICGCGVSDEVGPSGIPICLIDNLDLCPEDPDKKQPGVCGCGVRDIIDPKTGTYNCLLGTDLCPEDPDKTTPGVCGCGVPDDKDPETGIPICLVDIDLCPGDDNKVRPGICGCGVLDNDTDGDGYVDCEDACPQDESKYQDEGICGCGTPDTAQNLLDTDGDGIPFCLDVCPSSKWKSADDGCPCTSLAYTLNNTPGCAEIIATANDFQAFKTRWNAGEYTQTGAASDLAFIVVDDINLGSATSIVPENWEGVGTQDVPFSAIFLGDGHVFSAIRTAGTTEQRLTFGTETSKNVALFSYTKGAYIENLQVRMNFAGESKVAGLIANAEKTSVSRVTVSGEIGAQNIAGGVVAQFSGGSLKNIVSSSNVSVSGAIAGGIVGYMTDAQVSQVRTSGSISASAFAGGFAGVVTKASTLSNIATGGSVSGGSITGGMIGELSARSTLVNAYTTSKVTCKNKPCASLIAYINEFSTVKNAYTTGVMIDEVPETPVCDPEDPECADACDPGDPECTRECDPEDPECVGDCDPEDPDCESAEPEPCSPDDQECLEKEQEAKENEKLDPSNKSILLERSTASLIAAFGSADNVVDRLYYWEQIKAGQIPDGALDLGTVSNIFAFDYSKTLMPYVRPSNTKLLTLLKENLLCNNTACTLDGISCLQWDQGTFQISTNAGASTVSIPLLRISAN
ncbi:MAG: hypothetical protein IJ165_03580 [Proteobacteria bacterium]|nr:hypothetical protein [Pseudomonadota bacterium]